MDVNLCRLPDERKSMPKFPVPLADIMWHPYFDGQCPDSVKASEKTVYNQEK